MASKSNATNTPAKQASAGSLAINESSASVPAFMAGAKKASSDFDVEDLIIPRVTLLQGISPAVMAGEATNGHFWHTIMEEDLGDTLRLVPILYRKQYTLWNPLHMGGGVIARASDGKHWDTDFDVQVAPYKDFPKKLVKYSAKKGDAVGRQLGLGAWGSADPENEDSGPAATLSHVLMMMSLDHLGLGPFIVFLQRSSEPVARQLISRIKTVEDGPMQAPMYGQVYIAGSKVVPNSAGQEYNQYQFKPDGFVADADTFARFAEMHDTYKTARFRTNDEDVQADEAGGGASSGGGAGGNPDAKDDKY